MGSFANSLHVRSNDANAVVDAVRAALLDDGYQVTDDEPDPDAMGLDTALRALHVSAARAGWVSVLDSDLINGSTFGGELSARLGTHALHFLVNDSDSWHYQLYKDGAQVDRFDSLPDEFDDDDSDDADDAADAAGMLAAGGFGGVSSDVMQCALEIQQQLQQEMPDEIRDIQDRMQQGKASPEELKQYTDWTQTAMQKHVDGLRDLVGGAANAPPSDDAQPDVLPFPSDTVSSDHLDHLRPLLAAGVVDEQVLRVLGKQAVFAEEVLADFMDVVGIASLFARLSYRYLEETGESELSAANIRFVDHLKFAASSR